MIHSALVKAFRAAVYAVCVGLAGYMLIKAGAPACGACVLLSGIGHALQGAGVTS